MRSRFLPGLFLCALLPGTPTQETPEALRAQAELARSLGEQGIWLDRERGVVGIPASVLVRRELLEYLLVGPNGAAHESLILTPVRPSLLNAALLLLGVEPGRNARWEEQASVSPADEHEQGRPRRSVYPPEGDGFFLYAAWRERGETYFFRVEDLLANLETGRTLRRHRWVFLGSRFATLRPGEPEVFLADIEGNLVNISFFFQGNTLLTPAVEECIEQTIWVANAWLVPPRDQPVRLFIAKNPLERLDPTWEQELPEVDPAAEEDR